MSATGDETDPTYERTERTTPRRDERGSYDRELVHAILDEAVICHVGFDTDRGPVVIPTIHARIDETLYLHGSPATRMLRTLGRGVDVCVTVTLLDGLVVARSAFHHSLNYRSVVVFGQATPVKDLVEKEKVVTRIVEHVMPGRSDESRVPNEKELRGTSVLAVPLVEVSAKVRSGGPVDEREDLDLPIWGGEVPFVTTLGSPVADAHVGEGIEVPASITAYRRSTD